MAVPMSMTMMGWGYFCRAATEEATMSAPSWLWTSARIFIPVFTPGPTIMGRTPLSWRMASAMAPVMGGTTLETTAPVTSRMSA